MEGDQDRVQGNGYSRALVVMWFVCCAAMCVCCICTSLPTQSRTLRPGRPCHCGWARPPPPCTARYGVSASSCSWFASWPLPQWVALALMALLGAVAKRGGGEVPLLGMRMCICICVANYAPTTTGNTRDQMWSLMGLDPATGKVWLCAASVSPLSRALNWRGWSTYMCINSPPRGTRARRGRSPRRTRRTRRWRGRRWRRTRKRRSS